jgi:replicative DNA helicase
MVVLSQLTRDNARQKRKPELSDLRESGSIEQDADLVMFPYAGEIPDPRPPVLDYDLLLAKQREGPLGPIPLSFTLRHTRFDERAT